MSNIRVTYSGLIGLVINFGRILTGMLFVIIVTRQLEPEEFGMWAIIGSMLAYFLITEGIISYWSTRQISRGTPVGKTAMVSSLLFGSGSTLVYIVSAYFFSYVEPTFRNSMMLAAVLMPVMFISYALSGINLGYKPHATSIGLLTFESLKVPAGLVLVFFLDLGLDGVIVAVLIAYIGKIIIQLRYAKPKLLVSLDFTYMRNWLKQCWVPLYSSIANIIWHLDVVIFPIITGSVVGVAYYAAASAVTNVIAHTGVVSQALYPKLLARGSNKHISENFVRFLYFAIPLLTITIIFSKYALFLLNPEYTIAGTIVILLSFKTLFYLVINFFQRILLGIETVDVQNSTASKLFTSKLFLVPNIANIQHVLYIIILVIFLYAFQDLTDLELVTIWSAILLTLSFIFMIYYGILVGKNAAFSMPYGAILKYTIASACMAAIFLLTHESIVAFEASISAYVLQLISASALCAFVYISITYAIDHNTRKLFKAVIAEIFSWKSK